MVREIPVFNPSEPVVTGGPSGWLRVVDSTAPSTNESAWCQAAQGVFERVESARDHESSSPFSRWFPVFLFKVVFGFRLLSFDLLSSARSGTG